MKTRRASRPARVKAPELPENIYPEIDHEIDTWARGMALGVKSSPMWNEYWVPRERALLGVIRQPKRLVAAFQLLSLVDDALDQIDIPDPAGGTEPTGVMLYRLRQTMQARIAEAVAALPKRTRGRRPTNYPLAVFMARVLAASSLKPWPASRYIARRVSRVWTAMESSLTPQQVKDLWGSWSRSPDRERHLAERIRKAYDAHFPYDQAPREGGGSDERPSRVHDRAPKKATKKT